MTLTSFLRQSGTSVVYRPALVAIVGSVKATILFDQLIYWSDGLKKAGGWIYMTQEMILERTGLTRYEQEGARKNLKSRGFLEEKYSGVPRKLYFKLNEDAINKAWEKHQKNLENQHNAENSHTRPRKNIDQACGKNSGMNVEKQQAYKQYPNTSSNNTTNQGNCVSELLSILLKTPFSRISNTTLQKAIERYGFCHVFETAHILAYQSRKGKTIKKPSAYFAHCLKTGLFSPDGYIPYPEQQAMKSKKTGEPTSELPLDAIEPDTTPFVNRYMMNVISEVVSKTEIPALKILTSQEIHDRKQILKDQANLLSAREKFESGNQLSL